MQEILLYSGNKVGLTVYNWRIPKKRYSKAREICGFSQNLPLGVLVGNVCFLCGRLANFREILKNKMVMIFSNL